MVFPVQTGRGAETRLSATEASLVEAVAIGVLLNRIVAEVNLPRRIPQVRDQWNAVIWSRLPMSATGSGLRFHLIRRSHRRWSNSLCHLQAQAALRSGTSIRFGEPGSRPRARNRERPW